MRCGRSGCRWRSSFERSAIAPRRERMTASPASHEKPRRAQLRSGRGCDRRFVLGAFSSRRSRDREAIRIKISLPALRPLSIGLSRPDQRGGGPVHPDRPTGARDEDGTGQLLRRFPCPKGFLFSSIRPASRKICKRRLREHCPHRKRRAAPRILDKGRPDGSGLRPECLMITRCSLELHVVNFRGIGAPIERAAFVVVPDHDWLVVVSRLPIRLCGNVGFNAGKNALGGFFDPERFDVASEVDSDAFLSCGLIASEQQGSERFDRVHFLSFFFDVPGIPRRESGAFCRRQFENTLRNLMLQQKRLNRMKIFSENSQNRAAV